MTLKELKTLQKARAAKLKADRLAHKQSQRESKPSPLQCGAWSLHRAANEYRLHHIAYCLEHGTPYELIEPKVRDGNMPDWKQIEKIQETLKEAHDAEIVCASAV